MREVKKREFLLVFVASIFLMVASARAASFGTFGDETSFLTSAGPGLNLIDFEGLGNTLYTTYDSGNGAVFSSTGGDPDAIFIAPAGFSPDIVTDSLFANIVNTPLVVDFSPGVTAVGSDIISWTDGSTISIIVRDEFGDTSNYFVNANAAAYFGIIASGAEIDRITYYPGDLAVGVDNLYFGIAAVPAPASILLLATGLVGLAGVRRKKFIKK